MKILEDYADTLEQASIDEAYLDCSNKISSSNYNMSKRICQRN
jgi:nucleotidyltransferase/DNA polymerase involved in DNA repair